MRFELDTCSIAWQPVFAVAFAVALCSNKNRILPAQCNSVSSTLYDEGTSAATDAVRAAEELIGTEIDGRYRVDRLLGAGGMGLVYEVTHTRLGKKLAIKVLRPELAADEQSVLRFAQEAKLATSLASMTSRAVFLPSIGAVNRPSKAMFCMVSGSLSANASAPADVLYEHFGGKEGLYAVVVDRDDLGHKLRDRGGDADADSDSDADSDTDSDSDTRWSPDPTCDYLDLWDPEWPPGKAPHEIARQPFGNITFANSDAGAYAMTEVAIDEAWRAVNELQRGD